MSDAGDTSADNDGPEDLRDSLSEEHRKQDKERRRQERAVSQQADDSGDQSATLGIAGNGARLLLIGGAIVVGGVTLWATSQAINGTPDKSPVDYFRNDDGCTVNRDGNVIDDPNGGLTAIQCKQLENRQHVDGLGADTSNLSIGEIPRTIIPALAPGAPRNSWSDPGRAVDPSPGLGLELSL